jgi:EAL domain-containing protein (putative c-di-GMP-specific phosphodiesterase class I)/DNA-binding NarL/FixJ family response regulator
MGDGARENRPIKVVIADDDPSVARYLSLVLSLEDGDFDVVGVAVDAGSAVDVVTEADPDVLLLDLRMPGGGVRAAQLVSALNPSTRVLVFTADAQGTELLDLLRAGVSGYLTKSATSDEVVAAVRSVANGGRPFVADIAARAVDELTTRLNAEHFDEARMERRRQRIDRTIKDRAFTIALQPVVDLTTGEPRGAEALTCFGDASRSPSEWFAEAEVVSRRIDLELAAAHGALALRDSLSEGLWLSINLSPTTVLSGVIDRLFVGVDLSQVVIELTEHAAIEDDGFLNATLDRWRARGLRVAVSDAGGGYASFAHVVNARPDLIKLDASLTMGIETDLKKQALAIAISAFADRAGIEIIAGGIENEAQLDLLREAGARYGQGDFWGQPAALDQQPGILRT